MSQAIQELAAPHLRGVNLAAALALEQLTYARQIVAANNPVNPMDQQLVAAVLQAIATNYVAVVTRNVG